jgi:Domain of unknown function (DUF4340)
LKNSKFKILFALTAIAVGLAVFDFQNQKKETRQKAESAKIFSLSADQVAKIQLDDIVLAKSVDGWKMDQPIQDLADNETVESYLEAMLNENAQTLVPSAPLDWSKFGLVKPKHKLVLSDNTGHSSEIETSSVKNFEGAVYLRRKGTETPLIANSSFETKLEHKVFDFRIKKILRRVGGDLKSIHVINAKNHLMFENTDGIWKFAKASGVSATWALDQNTVRELVGPLTANSVTAFASETPATEAQKKEWGFSNKSVEITVTWKDEKTQTIRWAQQKDQSYLAEVSGLDKVVKISQGDGDRFAKFMPENFRDKAAPFRFKAEDAKQIRVKLGQEDSVFEKKNDKWTAQGETKLSGGRLGDWLDQVQRTKLENFVTDRKMIETQTQFEILGADSQALLELKFGSAQKIKTAQGEKSLVLAVSNLETDPFFISETEIDSLRLLLKAESLDAKKAP